MADLLAEMQEILGSEGDLARMRDSFVFKNDERKKKKRRGAGAEKKEEGASEAGEVADLSGVAKNNSTAERSNVVESLRGTSPPRPPASVASGPPMKKRKKHTEEAPRKQEPPSSQTAAAAVTKGDVLRDRRAPFGGSPGAGAKKRSMKKKKRGSEDDVVSRRPADVEGVELPRKSAKIPASCAPVLAVKGSACSDRGTSASAVGGGLRNLGKPPTGGAMAGLLANLRANATGVSLSSHQSDTTSHLQQAGAPALAARGPAQQESNGSLLSSSAKKAGKMRSRLEQDAAKLAGSRFRELNEELYTIEGKNAFKWFKSQPHLFEVYHKGFAAQAGQWPEKPVDRLITYVRNRFKVGDKWRHLDQIPAAQTTEGAANPLLVTIADLGCGEAQVAAELDGLICGKKLQKTVRVLSFDMVGSGGAPQHLESKGVGGGRDRGFAAEREVATNGGAPRILAANINSHVPTNSASVDCAILCLALMGTDCGGALREAFRILKPEGILLIAEVTSRFESRVSFVRQLEEFGFRRMIPVPGGGAGGASFSVSGDKESDHEDVGGLQQKNAVCKSKKNNKKADRKEQQTPTSPANSRPDALTMLEVENSHFFTCAFAKKGGLRRPPDGAKLVAKACIYKRR